jgi:hypothetical protein
MPKSTREPSLLKDVGAIAGLYVDLFRMMEKRATGHSLIVKYTPPEEMPPPHAAVAESERKREHAHARG